MRVLDFDPEFMWDEGELFPATLIGRAREHARHCYEREFVGQLTHWHVNPGRGISFVALICEVCWKEIGRGIVWRTPPSDDAYPWQAGYWSRVG